MLTAGRVGPLQRLPRRPGAGIPARVPQTPMPRTGAQKRKASGIAHPPVPRMGQRPVFRNGRPPKPNSPASMGWGNSEVFRFAPPRTGRRSHSEPHCNPITVLFETDGRQVIAGTADRLLVEETRVLVADFKTARRPPATLEEMPRATLRQMAAYAAALERIYPGRRIEAAVLYTQAPRLIAIPAELLESHKPGLTAAEESFAG